MNFQRSPFRSLAALGFIATLLFVVAALPLQLRAADEPVANGWPEGWLFRVKVTATDAAPGYDVMLGHGGLAQADGRDIRVVAADGKVVRHFIGFAETGRVRVLFDGAAGAGDYLIYFGNLSPALPPPPASVSSLVPNQWTPHGGYSAVSYAQVKVLDKPDLLNAKAVLESFASAAQAAQAEADKQTDPAQKERFIRKTVFRNTNIDLGPGYYHVVTAQINIATAGEYEFIIGMAGSSELGVLFLDGTETVVIPGWYSMQQSLAGISTTGKVNLPAGKHVLTFYTNRRNPEIRLRVPGSTNAEYLDGHAAHFDDVLKLTPGDYDSGSQVLPDAYLSSVRGWIDQGSYAHARALARSAQERFAADPDRVRTFSAEYERAGSAAYEKNWLTEGRFPSRVNAVPEATLMPPLRNVGASAEGYNHDQRHISSNLWVEGKLIYGLPFIAYNPPWAITSATSVADGVLYVGTKNAVMRAINLASQSILWEFPGGGSCLGPPLVYQGKLFYGTLDRRLYALNIDTGRMLWNFPTDGWIEGGAAASDGRIYFGSRDGNLYGIDAELGVERWHAALGGRIVSTPCTDGKLVFVGTGTGDFYGVDAASGAVVWKYSAGNPILGGACVGNGLVSFGDSAGHVHCLNTTTGKLVWSAPATVGGPIISAPVLVGTFIYGGTEDGKLFGIDTADGVVGWAEPMPGGGMVYRPPFFVNNTLVFTSRDRTPLGPDGRVVGMRGNSASYQIGTLPPILAEYATTRPSIDGDLSDPVWQAAKPFTSFLKPNGMKPAEENLAQVRALWDEKTLYLSITVKDSDIVALGAPAPQPPPALPTPPAPATAPTTEIASTQPTTDSATQPATQATAPETPPAVVVTPVPPPPPPAVERDAPLRTADAVTLLLDPRRDGVGVYEFVVGAGGTQGDVLHTGVGIDPKNEPLKKLAADLKLPQTGAAWNPEWTVAVKTSGTPRAPGPGDVDADTGWTVELAIPFESLPKEIAPPPGPGAAWRINIVLTGSDGRTYTLAPFDSGDAKDAIPGNPARWTNIQLTPKPQ